MNRCFVFAGVLILAASLSSMAEGPDDRYVQIYNLIQEADRLNDNGQPQPALEKYLEAQNALQQFLAAHPSWNEKLVRFRIEYVAAKLSPLASRFPATNAATNAVTASTNSLDVASGTRLRSWQDEVNRLTAQNTLLEAKLKEAWSVQPAATDSTEFKRLSDRVLQLERENDLLKVAWRQEQARNSTPPDTALSKPEKQLALAKAANKQLEQERDDLRTKLNAVNRQFSRPSGASAPGEIERQLEIARARLELYEARPLPYSAEELALLNRPESKPPAADPAPLKKRIKEPPPGTGALMAQALAAAEAGRFAEAEQKLLQVLRQDERNTYTLTYLGGVQLDMDHLADAEKNLKQALVIDPEDPDALSLMGQLKFLQKYYDEALNALSLAARLKPEDPRTQYLLGRTFVLKGNRNAAETAFRKALQLMPGSADVHYQLAEVYTLQQPPSIQLAQWHYKKALARGVPRNEQLEKLMAGKAEATAAP